MEDLLDKFAIILDECRYADKMLNSTEDKDEEQHWSDVLNYSAVELYDFLIEHDATVTFPAPSAPAAPVNPYRVGDRVKFFGTSGVIEKLPEWNNTALIVLSDEGAKYIIDISDVTSVTLGAPQFDPNANYELREHADGTRNWYRRAAPDETS